MKRILFITALFFLLNFAFITTKAFAAEISNGPMTLELSQSIQAEGVSQAPVTIRLNVPDAWSMSMKKNDRNDFIFKHLTEPDKIEISLINMATYFKNEESKTRIFDSSVKAGEDSIKKNVQKLNAQYDKTIGVDNILNNKINYSLFTLKTKEETTYYKCLYPTSKDNLFLIYILFKDGAPFQDAEQLINNIVLAITSTN